MGESSLFIFYLNRNLICLTIYIQSCIVLCILYCIQYYMRYCIAFHKGSLVTDGKERKTGYCRVPVQQSASYHHTSWHVRRGCRDRSMRKSRRSRSSYRERSDRRPDWYNARQFFIFHRTVSYLRLFWKFVVKDFQSYDLPTPKVIF